MISFFSLKNSVSSNEPWDKTKFNHGQKALFDLAIARFLDLILCHSWLALSFSHTFLRSSWRFFLARVFLLLPGSFYFCLAYSLHLFIPLPSSPLPTPLHPQYTNAPRHPPSDPVHLNVVVSSLEITSQSTLSKRGLSSLFFKDDFLRETSLYLEEIFPLSSLEITALSKEDPPSLFPKISLS